MKVAAFGALIALSAPACAERATPSSANGRWIFEIGKSSPSGGTPPRSTEVVLRDDGKALHWDMTSVDAEGKTTRASGADIFGEYTPSADGKLERMMTRIDASTIKRSVRYAEGGSLEDVCKFSGAAMVCEGVRTSKGKPAPSRLIFTKAR